MIGAIQTDACGTASTSDTPSLFQDATVPPPIFQKVKNSYAPQTNIIKFMLKNQRYYVRLVPYVTKSLRQTQIPHYRIF